MISRKRVFVQALILSGLSICAFGAFGASGAELTAVSCTNVGAGGKYNTSACVTPATAGNFETKALTLATETPVTAKSTETEPALRATLGGAALTVKCATSELVGAKLTNREPTAGKHTIETTATSTKYTGCTAVLKSNETRNCLVEGTGGVGTITTNALKSTTTGVAHQVKVEPSVAGGVFVKFTILNAAKGGSMCFFAADVPVEVKGSVEGEANTDNHAHLTFTDGNNGVLLKANGAVANYFATVGGVTAAGGLVVGAETFT